MVPGNPIGSPQGRNNRHPSDVAPERPGRSRPPGEARSPAEIDLYDEAATTTVRVDRLFLERRAAESQILALVPGRRSGASADAFGDERVGEQPDQGLELHSRGR
jgi:hypothetical protein